MNIVTEWFQYGDIPANTMRGYYDFSLVALTYAIAALTVYVALNLVGRLRSEDNPRARRFWLVGGAFTTGLGIWAMQFISTLSFIMRLPMEYDFIWIASSFYTAMLFAMFLLYFLQKKQLTISQWAVVGFLLGLGLSAMDFMGKQGMDIHLNIYYLPLGFFLAVFLAIASTEITLWLGVKSNQGAYNKQFNLKIVSSLIIALLFCLMLYAGSNAIVYIPNNSYVARSGYDFLQPAYLAYIIAGVTALILILVQTAAYYYKQIIEAVENEKEFLKAMLDNLKDGIIACDSDAKITVINRALQKNIPITVLGKLIYEQADLFMLKTKDEHLIEKDQLPLVKALNGDQVRGDECLVEFNDQLVREVVIDGQPIINADGKKLGAVTVIHDVTELRRTEKLKNEFVSIVSHELRTPLTSIRGSLGLLVSGMMGSFSDKAQKLLEIANNNCERLLLLINDILDIEKIEAGKMKFHLQQVELNTLINDAVEANKMYGEKYGVTLHFEPLDKKVEVNVDPDRLIQVLANLISNACKFSPKGESVIVSIGVHDEQARVSVIDKGQGIPAEFQARIFQKFSQADSSDTRGKGGTGLGLNISKTIIEKFGGRLNFISKPKQGTTFYFELPLLSSEKALQEKKRLIDLVVSKKRLLICEDDEDQSHYLQALLESAGFVVDVANTVSEAKKLLAVHQYQALLLDLILPDQDGIAFIRELRASEKTSNLHIIVLSVIAQTGKDLLNGDAFSVVDWLDKPVEFNTLLSSINRIKKKNPAKIPHILHVEDNLDTQHVVGVLLEEHAKVTRAKSLQEAKEMLEKEPFDLVILDLLLPDGNGSEILPLIAKYGYPVLVFSNIQLNEEYAQFISQALIKSNSSNEMLLNTIQKLL